MTWKNLLVILTRIHGNPLDILIWSQTDQGDFPTGKFTTGNGERLPFLARVTGKLDKTGAYVQTGTGGITVLSDQYSVGSGLSKQQNLATG